MTGKAGPWGRFFPPSPPPARTLLPKNGRSCTRGSVRDIWTFIRFLYEMFCLGAVLALSPQPALVTSQDLIMSLFPHLSGARRGDRADIPSLSFSGTWVCFSHFLLLKISQHFSSAVYIQTLSNLFKLARAFPSLRRLEEGNAPAHLHSDAF